MISDLIRGVIFTLLGAVMVLVFNCTLSISIVSFVDLVFQVGHVKEFIQVVFFVISGLEIILGLMLLVANKLEDKEG